MCNSWNTGGTDNTRWYRNNGCRSCGTTNNARPANNGQQAQQTNTSTNPFSANNKNATLDGWKKQANGVQTKDYNMGCSNVTLWGDNDGDDNVQVNNGVMIGNTMSSDEGRYETLRDYGDVMQIGDKYYMPPSQKEMDEFAKANDGCASKMWTELNGDDLNKYLKLKNGETVVMGEDKAKDNEVAVLGQNGDNLPSKKEAEKILKQALDDGSFNSIQDPENLDNIAGALASEVDGRYTKEEEKAALETINDMRNSLGDESTDDDVDGLIDDESDAAYEQAQSEAGVSDNDFLSLAKGTQITINPDKIEAAESFYNNLGANSTMAKALKASIDDAKAKMEKEIEETQI